MKLSISNIAWDSHNDFEVYELMQKYGFTGLEIAPTRFFPEKPYDHLIDAANLANNLKSRYNFEVCSMQSILFGRAERIFENAENQRIITDYLFKAIDFASAISCKNLVFGSPRNRCLINQKDYESTLRFFEILGEYAVNNGTVMSIEANPAIYGTNFINYTTEAVKIVKEVDSKGFRINLDFGTIIENSEDVDEITSFLKYINHIHISEPGLLSICRRDEHRKLASILKENLYEGFISIEMKKGEDGYLQDIEKTMNYICEVFGN